MVETASGRADGEAEALAREFMEVRPRLLAVAYRMLGSAWDAEDVVAEAMIRWLAVDRQQVREPIAFLTTVVTRLALDQLRSARATRERYVGPWLPEPVATGTSTPGPLDVLERRETASLATLRMMETLTPPERAVLVLHEAFDVPYPEIAEILGITVNAARQHLHRAKARVAGEQKRFEPDAAARDALFDRFLAALDGGDLDELRDLLAADVVAYSDGGGKVRAARHPLVGIDRVMHFWGGLTQRLPITVVQRLEVNGHPAALLEVGDQRLVVAVAVQDGKVVEIDGILNPDKLQYLYRQLS